MQQIFVHLLMFQDVHTPFPVCNIQPTLVCDVFRWQASTVYAHLISIKTKPIIILIRNPPYCYLGGIWVLHSGCGSCTGGLLLCRLSRCRWPCRRFPEADSCTVGARPCWAGSCVKLMPCSPGGGQKHKVWLFCCLSLHCHLKASLTCLTPKPIGGNCSRLVQHVPNQKSRIIVVWVLNDTRVRALWF